MTASAATEEAAVENARTALEQRGYTVEVRPSPSSLPDFLKEFQPDIVAQRNNEHLVVEVKLRGSSRPVGSDVARLAEVLADKPNWNFELIVVKEPARKPQDEPREQDFPIVLERLTRLERDGQTVAALLLGWSILEAAARRRLEQLGEDPEKASSPRTTVELLSYWGLLSDEDTRWLLELAETRNQLAHGFLNAEVPADALEMLRRIILDLLTSHREAA